MRLVLHAVILLFAFPGVGFSRDSTLTCATNSAEIPVPFARPAVLAVDSGRGNVLVSIEEQGRDVEWRLSGESDFNPVQLRPPRLGQVVFPAERPFVLEIRNVGPNRLPARVRVGMECYPAPEDQAFARCLETASRMDSPVQAARLLLYSRQPRCRAFLLHSAAAFVSARDYSEPGATLYATAVDNWLSLDDRARAAAASLGLAERLTDLGKLAAAFAAIDRAIALATEAGSAYYAARAKSHRCILREYEQSSSDTTGCTEGLMAEFARIGEISEVANVQYNLGFHWLHQGDIERASGLLGAANAFDPTALTPAVTGRLRYLTSQIDLKRGLIAKALANLDKAYEIFSRTGDRRWLANLNLQAARVYEQLSAPEEAAVFQRQARRFFEDTHAELRLIAVIELEALLLRQQGEYAGARFAAADAARRYQSEGMNQWAIDAWLHAIDVGVGEDAWRALDNLVAATDITSESQRIDIELARATEALREGIVPHPELASRLERLAAQALSVDQLQHARRLQAQALIRAGDAERAFSLLDAELVRQVRLADALGTSALRHLALRQARKLGVFWVDAAMALADSGRIDTAMLRSRLRALRIESVFTASGRDRNADSSVLDAALSGAVLPSSEDDPSTLLEAQRSLLRFYARADASQPRRTFSETSPAVRSALPVPQDAVQLTYALGETRSMALVVDGDQAVLEEIGAPSAIRRSAARLAALAYRRETNVAELSAAAKELSALILPASLTSREPPAQLWIEGEELFAAIPFALLPWPGQDWPLVESTAVSFRFGRERLLPEPSSGIDVIVAAQPAGSDSAELPWLRTAEAEPDLLAASVPDARVRVHAGAQADRARLDELLRRRDAWLHIAAHGVSRSGFQGLAGLWLTSPDGGHGPVFVSWLGLTDRPLAASLVVLNACQLADTGAAVASSASFAAALAAAGVNHVVAARWQVSDNASTVWVPAFYAALRDDPQRRVATAVQQAQLALLHSRQFRHPFHWAGLAHLVGGNAAGD
jgi:CHAT domain-containing protein